MTSVMDEINAFRDARGWGSAHTPRNLATSISIEAAELLENYQWGEDYADAENVKEELADILIYAYTMANVLGLDVDTIMREKIVKNGKKYPLEEKND